MIFKQFYLNCLAHASYLIGDKASRTAAVIDPQRDIDQYVKFAKKNGLRLRHVLLTHFHADFVSGHLELADIGARLYLGAKAKADYPFTPLKDGDTLEFGKVRLKVLETPGHTPEAISLLVYDLGKSSVSPHAVLTGDTLFIGDVGRPDLMASVGLSAETLAGMLYDSLHNKLMPLPDKTLLYPAHGAGSFCGKNISADTVSTIGNQRRSNYALKPMQKKCFIKLVTADQPETPDYFAYDAEFNRLNRPTLKQTLKNFKPLPLTRLRSLQKKGAQILDTREPADFNSAHIKGAVNIGLDGKFATWAGTLLSRDQPIVIIAAPGREEEAALRLGRIGFDSVAGSLKGGMLSVPENSSLLDSTRRLSPLELSSLLESPRAPTVLDVRTPMERKTQHIPGSVHIPLSRLRQGAKGLKRNNNFVVQCAGGYRSSIAASLLKNWGFKNVQDLAGGMAAWTAAELTVSTRG